MTSTASVVWWWQEIWAPALSLDPSVNIATGWPGLVVSLRQLAFFMYAMATVQRMYPQRGPVTALHSIVECVITAYGGSILVPMLLGSGRMAFPLASELGVLHIIVSWVLYHNFSFIRSLCNGFPLTLAFDAASETARMAVMVGWFEAARHDVPGSSALMLPGAPVLSWIICGTLGGCGGAFLPMTRGIDALKTTAVHIVLLGAVVYCFLTLPDEIYATLPKWLSAFWAIGEEVAPVSKVTAQAIVALGFVIRQWSLRPELGPPGRLLWLALQGKAHLDPPAID